LEIKSTEMQIKDEELKRQDAGNDENLTMYKN
jgi:hypothetical protein